MSEHSTTSAEFSENSNPDWLIQLPKYLRYWYWFALSISVCLVSANVYLRYTPNSYQSSAKIKILDNSTNSFKMPSDGISLFSKSKLNLENEVEVIKSHRIMEKVVQKLNLTTAYTQTGYVKSSELWANRPFDVEWIGDPTTIEASNVQLTIQLKGDGYILTKDEDTPSNIT